jgi:hypothetical protein
VERGWGIGGINDKELNYKSPHCERKWFVNQAVKPVRQKKQTTKHGPKLAMLYSGVKNDAEI